MALKRKKIHSSPFCTKPTPLQSHGNIQMVKDNIKTMTIKTTTTLASICLENMFAFLLLSHYFLVECIFRGILF